MPTSGITTRSIFHFAERTSAGSANEVVSSSEATSTLRIDSASLDEVLPDTGAERWGTVADIASKSSL